MGNLIQLRVRTIGEDDDGKLPVREARDPSAEADGLAAVPDFPQAAILADEPPIAVAAARLVRRSRRREGDPERPLADKFRLVERLIPLEQIRQRRINPAVAENGTGEALVGALEFPILGRVAERTIRHGAGTLFVSQRIRHFQRLENILLQEARKLLP